MKTLYLIRHAKSDWGDPFLPDHDRPLNERGTQDAPYMGKMMLQLGWQPDRWLSSTALRAKQTAELMSRELGVPADDLYCNASLYLAEPDAILQQLARMDSHHHSLAVVAHNPGISDLAHLLGLPYTGGMPTCAIAVFRLNIEHWLELTAGDVNAEPFAYKTPTHLAMA